MSVANYSVFRFAFAYLTFSPHGDFKLVLVCLLITSDCPGHRIIVLMGYPLVTPLEKSLEPRPYDNDNYIIITYSKTSPRKLLLQKQMYPVSDMLICKRILMQRGRE